MSDKTQTQLIDPIDDGLVGRNVRIETIEGSFRNGMITGVEWHEIELRTSTLGLFHKEEQHVFKRALPVMLQLNHDANDGIEFRRIRRIYFVASDTGEGLPFGVGAIR